MASALRHRSRHPCRQFRHRRAGAGGRRPELAALARDDRQLRIAAARVAGGQRLFRRAVSRVRGPRPAPDPPAIQSAHAAVANAHAGEKAPHRRQAPRQLPHPARDLARLPRRRVRHAGRARRPCRPRDRRHRHLDYRDVRAHAVRRRHRLRPVEPLHVRGRHARKRRAVGALRGSHPAGGARPAPAPRHRARGDRGFRIEGAAHRPRLRTAGCRRSCRMGEGARAVARSRVIRAAGGRVLGYAGRGHPHGAGKRNLARARGRRRAHRDHLVRQDPRPGRSGGSQGRHAVVRRVHPLLWPAHHRRTARPVPRRSRRARCHPRVAGGFGDPC